MSLEINLKLLNLEGVEISTKSCPASKLCAPCLADRVCKRASLARRYTELEMKIEDITKAIEAAFPSNETGAYKDCPNLKDQIET